MAGKQRGKAMMNIMSIDGYKAVIQYDPVLDTFRGEFIGLNGGADFYASTLEELKKEGGISLKVFLEMCEEEGINPRKKYSGKFNLRVPPELHAEIAARAAAEGKSLNKCVTDLLGDAVHTQ
jgi:predicted HicB family RNase H-like nuclease